MTETFQTHARSLRALGTGLALAGVAALPMQALAQAIATDAAKPAQAQDSVEFGANQVVVRDAATGHLRAASPDEANALRSRVHALRSAPQAMMPRVHYSGARGTRLTDEHLSHSVVVRQPDGSLATLCFDSREEAEAATKASATTAKPINTVPTE